MREQHAREERHGEARHTECRRGARRGRRGRDEASANGWRIKSDFDGGGETNTGARRSDTQRDGSACEHSAVHDYADD
jgi:hypothetical protein